MNTGSPRTTPIRIALSDSVAYRTQTPVVNTTAGRWTVVPSGRPVLVTNAVGMANNMYVIVNEGTDPTSSNFMFIVQNTQTVDVSLGGIINVTSIRIFPGASGDTTKQFITFFK